MNTNSPQGREGTDPRFNDPEIGVKERDQGPSFNDLLRFIWFVAFVVSCFMILMLFITYPFWAEEWGFMRIVLTLSLPLWLFIAIAEPY